jgi:CBS-domain-containing membrane protein
LFVATSKGFWYNKLMTNKTPAHEGLAIMTEFAEVFSLSKQQLTKILADEAAGTITKQQASLQCAHIMSVALMTANFGPTAIQCAVDHFANYYEPNTAKPKDSLIH